MRLKAIKLAGFKSFVDPTYIPLKSNLTGVVGPNGCGKSNVIDAVRWVMGESSAKYLRGESSSDVIFNGSGTRKPLGQASVELHFDNSDGSLGGQYAQYQELLIRRELTRDGQSQYYFNGQRCRRKDIIDIFLGTGLGPRSYAIIEQGMISRLIDAKPHDLRQYLEEAAGVSRYKEKRHETELRLRHTQENLSRLNDVREEIGRQLEHLEKQAKAAERYQSLKEEEHSLRRQWWSLRWQRLKKELAESEEHIQRHQAQLSDMHQQRDHQQHNIQQQKNELARWQNESQAYDERWMALNEEIAQLEQSIRLNEERHQDILLQLETLDTQLNASEELKTEYAEKIRLQEEQLLSSAPELQALEGELQHAQIAKTEAQQALEEWQTGWQNAQRKHQHEQSQHHIAEARHRDAKQHAEQAAARLERLNTDRARCEAEQAVLQEQELKGIEEESRWKDEAHQLQEQIKALQVEIERAHQQSQDYRQQLNQAQHQAQHDRGRLSSLEALQQQALQDPEKSVRQWLEQYQLQGTPRVLEQLRVEAGWERAVETVFVGAVRALWADESQQRVALAHLLELKSGDCALLGPSEHPLNEEDCAGLKPLRSFVLSEHRTCSWLNHVYAVESVAQAEALRSQLKDHQSVMTPEGIWIRRDSVRYHPGDVSRSGVVERRQQIETLQQQLQHHQDTIQRLEESLAVAHQEAKSLQHALQTLQQQHRESDKKWVEAQMQLKLMRQKQDELKRVMERADQEGAQLQQSREAYQRTAVEAEAAAQQAQQQALHWQQETERLSHEKDAHRERLAECERHWQRVRDELTARQMQRQQWQQQKHTYQQYLSQQKASLENHQQQKERMQQQLHTFSEPLPEWMTTLSELRHEKNQLSQQRQEVQQRVLACTEAIEREEQHKEHSQHSLAEVQTQIEQLRLNRQTSVVRLQTLEEELAPHEVTLEQLEEVTSEWSISECEQELQKTQQRIHRLGPINLAALQECTDVGQRKEYLDQQWQDLTTAVETLDQAMRKIDKESQERFKETFEQVKQGFAQYFPRLFGGGEAYLDLLPPNPEKPDEDPGVMVMARPPGKRNSTIHLLSGGEKALTAIALVFAFFQLNPAPFCMLDEVDAPLDEANVVRYSRMVQEMSKHIQFIFITHNKVTMEVGEQLMGVTMNEPGVSRLVAVDIAEAVQLADVN